MKTTDCEMQSGAITMASLSDFTSEHLVRAFECLSETRKNRAEYFSSDDKPDEILQTEDELYQLLLQRLKYEVSGPVKIVEQESK